MKRTTLNPAVLAFLERDRIATLNLIGILQNEPGLELLVDSEEAPRGVLVKGPWFWYVHTEDDAFLEALFLELQQKDGFYQFSGVWRPLAEKIKARFPLVWDAPCDLFYHPAPGNPRPQPAEPQARSVALEDAALIDQHYPYRHAGSLENIRKCIEHRHSSAIYVDGGIVSWLLVHEDDSLGIMHTLEPHRRKGYAETVTRALVRRQLADGKTPYLQIRDDNSLSPGLAQKCGFVKHGSCDWFGIVVGTPPELVEGGREFRRRSLAAVALPGRWQPDLECLCLFRFLHLLKTDPTEDNPVVEAHDEVEWTDFAAQHFEAELLRTRVQLGQKCRLLCDRRDGAIQAVAALLVDEDDACELLWVTSSEEAFLRHVLQRAKGMGLGAVFVHVPCGEQAVFEKLGFRVIETTRNPS